MASLSAWSCLTSPSLLLLLYCMYIPPPLPSPSPFLSLPLLAFFFNCFYRFILGLGVSHGALLGGMSQLASVFPDSCNVCTMEGTKKEREEGERRRREEKEREDKTKDRRGWRDERKLRRR